MGLALGLFGNGLVDSIGVIGFGFGFVSGPPWLILLDLTALFL